MTTSERLLKFTGDIKSLPYRELMEFSNQLAIRVALLGSSNCENLASALVDTAVALNPDVDPETDKSKRRSGLASGLGINS